MTHHEPFDRELWRQVIGHRVPFVTDPNPIVNSLNEIEAVLDLLAARVGNTERDKIAIGAVLYERLQPVHAQILGQNLVVHADREREIVRRLMIELYDVPEEEVG